MIFLAEKLLEAIGEISDAIVEEIGGKYYSREKLRKTLKFGAIGLAASFGIWAAVRLYQANRGRKKSAA